MNKKQGCLLAGCLVLVAIGVALAVIFGALGYTVYNTAKSFTAEAPMEVAVYQPTAEEEQDARAKIATLKEALAQKKAVKVVLTQNDLNTLIVSHDKARELAGNFAVTIEGDAVKATGSLPLKKLNLPIFQDRYLNGTFSLKARLQNGYLELYPVSIVVNGTAVPADFMDKLRQQNLAKDLNSDPEKAALLKKLKSLEIRDGRVIIETVGE